MKWAACWALVAGLMLCGCGGVQYVDNAESKKDVSSGIEYHDLEKAASDNTSRF